MQLFIENMTCGGCARGVTATIHDIDPSAEVKIDLETKIVHVQTNVDQQIILDALAEEDFPAQVQ